MPVADQWERRFVPIEHRTETEGRKIKGYAIVFNSMSENLGGFKERIAPGFVDRTLREGVDVRALVDHDSAKVLGRLSAGTLRLAKDRTGLVAHISPPRTSYGADIVESVKRGDVSGMSFRFRITPDGDSWDEEDGYPVRTLNDGWISEVSVVTFPAYPETDAAVRSLRDFQQSAQWKPSHKLRDRIARAVKV